MLHSIGNRDSQQTFNLLLGYWFPSNIFFHSAILWLWLGFKLKHSFSMYPFSIIVCHFESFYGSQYQAKKYMTPYQYWKYFTGGAFPWIFHRATKLLQVVFHGSLWTQPTWKILFSIIKESEILRLAVLYLFSPAIGSPTKCFVLWLVFQWFMLSVRISNFIQWCEWYARCDRSLPMIYQRTDIWMTSRETCFLCFVENGIHFWKSLWDYVGLK